MIPVKKKEVASLNELAVGDMIVAKQWPGSAWSRSQGTRIPLFDPIDSKNVGSIISWIKDTEVGLVCGNHVEACNRDRIVGFVLVLFPSGFGFVRSSEFVRISKE